MKPTNFSQRLRSAELSMYVDDVLDRLGAIDLKCNAIDARAKGSTWPLPALLNSTSLIRRDCEEMRKAMATIADALKTTRADDVNLAAARRDPEDRPPSDGDQDGQYGDDR